MVKFSIVIPCKEIDEYTKECVEHCLSLDYDDYEILVLPDFKNDKEIRGVKIIPTGQVKPAIKRNIAIKQAGDICAFIDSDAYPEKNWLKFAEKYFEKEDVGAVGGPNLTPHGDSFWQKVSGSILASKAAGLAGVRYRKSKKNHEVDELPSCNLLVKTELAKKIGGYEAGLLTAEDSKFCYDIKKLGKKILYVPDVVVFHHRRKGIGEHLKQMWVYGRDVAYLLRKKYFSFKWYYYILPSLFILYIIFGGVLSFYSKIFRLIFIYSLVVYLFLMAILTIKFKKIVRWPFVFIGAILTHIFYGLGFLYGLIGRKK